MSKKLTAIQLINKNIEHSKKKSAAQDDISNFKKKNIHYKHIDYRLDSIYDLQATLEMPFFSLKKEILNEEKTWTRENKTAILTRHKIDSEQPTIKDKEMLILAINQILQYTRFNKNTPVPTHVSIPVARFFEMTNSCKSGRDYLRAKKSIERLSSAKFSLFIERNGIYLEHCFKIFESGHIADKNVWITLSNWTRSKISNKELLKLHSNYFQTRSLILRRMHEICRKHAGKNNKFSIQTKTFIKRIGTASKNDNFILGEIRKFNESDLGYIINPEANHWLKITPTKQNKSKL